MSARELLPPPPRVGLEAVHLEEWGRIADAAIAAYERTRVDEIAEAVEKRLRQRDRERGIVR